MKCSPPGSSVHGILQAWILEWVAMPTSGDLPNPGIEPRTPALQAASLQSEPPGKPLACRIFIFSPLVRSKLLLALFTWETVWCRGRKWSSGVLGSRPGSVVDPVTGGKPWKPYSSGKGVMLHHLPDVANENIGCPITFEFRVKNKSRFSITMSHAALARSKQGQQSPTFWHQGLVSCKTIFPGTRGQERWGWWVGVVWGDSSTLHLLCPLFLLLLYQLHLRSSGLRSWRLETLN